MSSARSTAAPFACGAALFLLASHVAARATRDALFLSNFPVTVLPRMMIAAALVTLLCAAGTSRLLARVAPTVLIPAGFLLSASLFVGEWFLVRAVPGIGSVAVYLHFAAIGAVLISGFWSVVNERFDPHTGKTVVARIGGFGGLGGVLGGAAAYQIAPRAGVSAMLLGLAVLHLGAGLAVLGIGRPAAGVRRRAEEERSAPPGSGLRILRRTPFLLQMAVLIGLLGVTEELIDYAFKAEAVKRFHDEASLVEFFAIFYTAANALAFLLQTALGARGLRRLGLGGAMALLPALVALGAAAATLLTRLWTVALARGANAVLALSFFRAGFELLYTPVAPETKRPTKAYIDVAAHSLGQIAGGALVLGLLLVIPELPTQVVLALVVTACLGALALVARLHRGYVRQLADNLRSGTTSVEETEELDATTARTLADTRVTLDRAELLARIRELKAREAAPEPGGTPATAARPAKFAAFFEQVSALASSEPARVRDALAAGRGDARLVPHVLPLLERFDVLDDALRFLRELAPRSAGQLTDALVDPERDVVTRRRIPRALEVCDDTRALDGLCLGLESEDFDVRLQCARAAARIVSRHPELRLPGERVFAFAERELAVDPQSWEHRGRRRQEAAAESVLLEGPELANVNRSVEHVFTLLGLALGPDMMGSTLRALHSGDANLRGTALEYLQAVLPERLRSGVWSHIPTGVERRRPQRPAQEIADELLRSSVSIRPLRGSG